MMPDQSFAQGELKLPFQVNFYFVYPILLGIAIP